MIINLTVWFVHHTDCQGNYIYEERKYIKQTPSFVYSLVLYGQLFFILSLPLQAYTLVLCIQIYVPYLKKNRLSQFN